MKTEFDILDAIALQVIDGDTSEVAELRTCQALYVALAANDSDLLKSFGYTFGQALDRLEPEWTANLANRWRFTQPIFKNEVQSIDPIQATVEDSYSEIPERVQISLVESVKKEPREQKVFRLKTTMIEALRQECFRQSERMQRRVTETELVEQALKSLLGL